MKRVLLLGLLLLSSIAASAQVNVSKELSDITGVKATGNIKLTLVKGNSNSFDAEIKGTTEDQFSWSVKDGVATFQLKKPLKIGDKSDVSATITLNYKDISYIEADGAEILSKEDINVSAMELDLSGKAVVSLTLNCDDVRIKSQNALATITGKTEYLTVRATTNASVNCSALNSVSATVTANTNAECYVNVSDKLDAKSNTNSNIFYKGDAKIINSSVSSFGNIQTY